MTAHFFSERACDRSYTEERLDWLFSQVREISLDIDETDSGKGHNDAVFYDLQGRKVSLPLHGIYILNGKKIIK